MLIDQLFKLLESKEEEMIQHRRYLHQHPELSFFEKETSQYLINYYQDRDCEVHSNIGGYGLKVIIDSNKPGKTIALRSDFDALAIQEETGLPFSSLNDGVMHACGHDGHTAYLMVLASCLIELKEKLQGKVVIIHQPAEEVPPGGAIAMIKDGVLEGVDEVYGIHLIAQGQLGAIGYHIGATQSARAKFSIKVQGKGGHGASPHETIDSIVAASALVMNLQTIVSRRNNPTSPLVITVGSFDGKGQSNVIKDSVILEGDVRLFDERVSVLVEKEMRSICQGIENMYGCKVTLNYLRDYPALINYELLTVNAMEAIKKTKIKGVKEIVDTGLMMSSEDFAYYSLERPSCYFYIGAKPQNSDYPHHHPKFDFHEDALMIAAKSVAAVLLSALETKED